MAVEVILTCSGANPSGTSGCGLSAKNKTTPKQDIIAKRWKKAAIAISRPFKE
jgi:hypothetical protein